jgi:tetratricopeptide (TPR) repeat protein
VTNDYNGAIEDFTKCIELIPVNFFEYSSLAYSYSSRARAKSNLGDYEGAIRDYTKAIELEPQDYFYSERG